MSVGRVFWCFIVNPPVYLPVYNNTCCCLSYNPNSPRATYRSSKTACVQSQKLSHLYKNSGSTGFSGTILLIKRYASLDTVIKSAMCARRASDMFFKGCCGTMQHWSSCCTSSSGTSSSKRRQLRSKSPCTVRRSMRASSSASVMDAASGSTSRRRCTSGRKGWALDALAMSWLDAAGDTDPSP